VITRVALQQVVSQQPSYSLHFMQLSGPEAELQATAAAASETGAGGQGALFVSMLRAAPSWTNITFSAFVAGEVCSVHVHGAYKNTTQLQYTHSSAAARIIASNAPNPLHSQHGVDADLHVAAGAMQTVRQSQT
jgi:hypothetical protein